MTRDHLERLFSEHQDQIMELCMYFICSHIEDTMAGSIITTVISCNWI
jgi:hypothetical protein